MEIFQFTNADPINFAKLIRINGETGLFHHRKMGSPASCGVKLYLRWWKLLIVVKRLIATLPRGTFFLIFVKQMLSISKPSTESRTFLLSSKHLIFVSDVSNLGDDLRKKGSPLRKVETFTKLLLLPLSSKIVSSDVVIKTKFCYTIYPF